MRQRLGKKKHAKCEQIAGRSYVSCWTRGGWAHGTAVCEFRVEGQQPLSSGDYALNSDIVNYLTGEWMPDCRNGQLISREALVAAMDKLKAQGVL